MTIDRENEVYDSHVALHLLVRHSEWMIIHWKRISFCTFPISKRQPTPVFLPGESQGWGSLVGCHLWGHTESDTIEATWQQQQQRSSAFLSHGPHPSSDQQWSVKSSSLCILLTLTLLLSLVSTFKAPSDYTGPSRITQGNLPIKFSWSATWTPPAVFILHCHIR